MRPRLIAEGEGWRLQEFVCGSGPSDPRFEETHAWTSVSAVLSGVFTYRTHAGRALMTPGSILLGEAGRCFECGHEHGTGDRCVSAAFSAAFVEDVLSVARPATRKGFATPAAPATEALLPLVTEARALVAGADPMRAELFCIRLASAAFALGADAEARRATPSDEARAGRAVRIIEARYAEPLTIDGLAAEVGLGRRRFATAFRRATGVSPYAYVLARRLDAAAALLQTGPRSVLEAALEAGFGDLSEFTRRFGVRFGRPPGRYARDWRRNGLQSRGLSAQRK
jgi:AraC-like DNA-binding protein